MFTKDNLMCYNTDDKLLRHRFCAKYCYAYIPVINMLYTDTLTKVLNKINTAIPKN